LKSGVKVSGTSPNGHALIRKQAEELQFVITRQHGDGPLKNIHHSQVFNTLEEDHSSCPGTTITELSLKSLLKANTTAKCTF
jgi:hypothetical protein